MDAYYEIEKIEQKPLLGEKALITGASRGIGLKIARILAAAGAALVLTEVPDRVSNLSQESEKIKVDFGVEVLPLSLDIRIQEQIEASIKLVYEKFGNIDILVNNAGVNIHCPALSITREQWDWVVDINLKGSFFVTQEIAKGMVKNKKGNIVSIASQHGIIGNEFRAPYCSSKAGLINLTRALAIEWARYGIRVNSVSPTFVQTDANYEDLNEPNFQRTNLAKIPLRKYALPEDVAQAVLFLVSPASKMITGHNLVVDGGWTCI